MFVQSRTFYCIDCIGGDEGKCSNKEWMDDWKEVILERESSVATTRQAVQDTEATLGDTAADSRRWLPSSPSSSVSKQ